MMVEIGLLVAVALAVLLFRDRQKWIELVEIDRAGLLMNTVLNDMQKLEVALRAETKDYFARQLSELSEQFPGDSGTRAVVHRWLFNSSDAKLAATADKGLVAQRTALARQPFHIFAAAMGAISLAELNVRRHRKNERFRRAAEDMARDVKDHFVVASSRTMGDVIEEIGMRSVIAMEQRQ
jgi:hypothetical protein